MVADPVTWVCLCTVRIDGQCTADLWNTDIAAVDIPPMAGIGLPQIATSGILVLMRPTFFIAALAMLAGVASADVRDFTQKDSGKTIQGEIRGVNSQAGTVTIILPDAKVVTFKQDMLVEADREFIATWAKENAFATNIRLGASKTTGERSANKGEVYQVKLRKEGYRVNVRNGSTTENIEPFTVNYTLVVERADGKMETKAGSHEVSGLAAGGSVDFETDKLDLAVDMKSLSSCPTCVATAQQFKGDDLIGINLVVEKAGKKATDVVFPSSREKKLREAIGGAATPKG